MLKAKTAGQDPYWAILDHRNTQRRLNRRTRTLLPIAGTLETTTGHDTTADEAMRATTRPPC